MAIETRERTEDDTYATEVATKVDVDAVSDKIEDLSETVKNLVVEVAKLQVGQKWIAWILGVVCAALIGIFCALVAIALQL